MLSWDYVAGFFDGEGHAGVYKGGGWRLEFSNTNLEVIQAIHAFLGCGTIEARNRETSGGLGTKAMYDLDIRRVDEIRYIAIHLLPRVIVKREALQGLYDHIKDRDARHENFGRAAAIDPLELRRLYWVEELSMNDIADRFDLTPTSIQRQLEIHGIPKRSKSEAMSLAYRNGRGRKTPLAQAGPKELYRLHWDLGYSLRDLATHFGCTRRSVVVYMDRYHVPRRSHAEALREHRRRHTPA